MLRSSSEATPQLAGMELEAPDALMDLGQPRSYEIRQASGHTGVVGFVCTLFAFFISWLVFDFVLRLVSLITCLVGTGISNVGL